MIATVITLNKIFPHNRLYQIYLMFMNTFLPLKKSETMYASIGIVIPQSNVSKKKPFITMVKVQPFHSFAI